MPPLKVPFRKPQLSGTESPRLFVSALNFFLLLFLYVFSFFFLPRASQG
jgi:hypothetical protein